MIERNKTITTNMINRHYILCTICLLSLSVFCLNIHAVDIQPVGSDFQEPQITPQAPNANTNLNLQKTSVQGFRTTLPAATQPLPVYPDNVPQVSKGGVLNIKPEAPVAVQPRQDDVLSPVSGQDMHVFRLNEARTKTNAATVAPDAGTADNMTAAAPNETAVSAAANTSVAPAPQQTWYERWKKNNDETLTAVTEEEETPAKRRIIIDEGDIPGGTTPNDPNKLPLTDLPLWVTLLAIAVYCRHRYKTT